MDPTAASELSEVRESLQMTSMTRSAIDEAELVEECIRSLRGSRDDFKLSRLLGDNKKGTLGADELTELAARMMEARSKMGTTKFVQCMSFLLRTVGLADHNTSVTWEDLSVEADAAVGTGAIKDVGRALVTLGGLLRSSNTVHVDLLHKSSGVIEPRRATLLLGPPGAGKSLLMKLLSGRVTAANSKKLSISGEIRYNAVDIHDFNVIRSASYVDQEDNHVPELTVRETLMFAKNCLMPVVTGTEKILISAERMLNAGRKACGKGRGEHTVDMPEKRRSLSLPPLVSSESKTTKATPKSSGEQLLVQLFTGSQAQNDAVLSAFEEMVSIVRDTFQATTGTHDLKVDVLMAILGLTICKDTKVGGPMMRGISGGQRKRVTSGEFLMGPSGVMFLDEISTGLDSATTYSVAQHLCESCREMGVTLVVSLLQPPPETVALFDDILLLGEGHVLYHGPRDQVLPFFASLGFECPERKDPASFLQEVTTAVGQREYATEALLAREVVPAGKMLVPCAEIARRFRESDEGRRRGAEAASRHRKADATDNNRHSDGLMRAPYAKSFMDLFRLVLSRQALLTARAKAMSVGRVMQCFILGVITGLLYLQLEKTVDTGRSMMGLVYTAIMFLAMGNAAQVGILIQGRDVFYKHRDNLFFHGMSYCFALTLTQTPVTVAEVFAYAVPVYFMVGLYLGLAEFFAFYAICFSCSMSLAAFFRTIAAWSKDMVTANSLMVLLIMLLILMSGFTIAVDDIPESLMFIYWVSPFAWSFKAAVVNEFSSPDWQYPADMELPGKCTSFGPGNHTCTAGEMVMEIQGIPFGDSGQKIGFAIAFNLGVTLVMTALAALGMTFMKAPAVQPVVASSDVSSSTAVVAGSVSNSEQQHRHVSSPPATGSPAVVTKHANRVAPVENNDELPEVPFQPLTLVWRDIHYFVPMPASSDGDSSGDKKSKAPAELELLKGVTGYARPNSMTALVGGSGAGKTTFMDVLAGRKTVGRITGDIFVNGRPKEQSTWARVCGYVEQTDIHMPRLTVRESLEFSAALRLDPATFDSRQVTANVMRVMDMVDLHPIADRLVGDPGGEGLSLEQRKRLTIGVELVSNPGVIFMDEPTSGLDAKAAATVIRAVRTIASSGRTVMLTIHQPSIEIFEAFDQVLLLHSGGYVDYFGRIGEQSTDLIAYLSGYPGVAPVPHGYNPATWMLEVTGGAPQTMIPAAAVDYPAEWPRSQLATRTAAECDALVADGLANAAPVAVSGGLYARGRSAQMWLLLCRFAREYWRNPAYNLTRWVMAVVQALLYGAIYYGQGKVEATDGELDVSVVFNIIGLAYSASLFSGMTGLMTAIPVVSTGRAVFYRERAVSMYGVFPYAAASALIEVPFLIVQICFLFVPIIYFMLQFEADVEKFFYVMLMFLASGATFTFFGQFLVFLTPNGLMAQILAGALNFFWNIFSGFGIPANQMPTYLYWISYICPTTYIIQGLCSAILGDSDILINAFGTPKTISEFLSDYFDYEYDFRYACLAIVTGFCMIFILTGSLALKYLNFNIR